MSHPCALLPESVSFRRWNIKSAGVKDILRHSRGAICPLCLFVLKEGDLLCVEVPNVRAEEFLLEFDRKLMDRSGHKNRLSVEEWVAQLNKH